MAIMLVNGLKSLFGALGCLMVVTLVYTLTIDGLPFRKELLTRWMAATLVDFYINIVPLAAWAAYKGTNWITAVLWIVLLVCFGSVTTCAFILMQLFKLPPQAPLLDSMSYVLVKQNSKDDTERKGKFCSIIAARSVFIALGCLMSGTLIYTIMTDGSPFRRELLTPWMVATLIDFYINVVAISVWVIYKESSWINAMLWIIMLICLGSITTCAYIIVQLFHLSPQDPLYLVLLNSHSRCLFVEVFQGILAVWHNIKT